MTDETYMEFREFPKMARLTRECIVTEKIDGTNASVFITNEPVSEQFAKLAIGTQTCPVSNTTLTMFAGSRTRWITPTSDNMGFATWCSKNVEDLFRLGHGHHFGEWWGSSIQRNYGLKGVRKFSLFNTSRWSDPDVRPTCCDVVPVLYQGVFCTTAIDNALKALAEGGSVCQPGFMNPEGIVVFHVAANVGFKKTILHDELPKSLAPV